MEGGAWRKLKFCQERRRELWMLARHLTKVSTINRFYYCFFLSLLFLSPVSASDCLLSQSLPSWQSWVWSYSAFSACAGLSLAPASSNERTTATYHFYFQLSFSSLKYCKPNTPGVQSYSEPAKGKEIDFKIPAVVSHNGDLCNWPDDTVDYVLKCLTFYTLGIYLGILAHPR